MARARDPNRNKAFEIYKKYGGKIDLVEIASQLNISPGTIRGWKSKDSWDTQLNGTLRKNTERSKRKKVVSRETKMQKVMVATGHREIRTQLRQESLKLSFLIPWM